LRKRKEDKKEEKDTSDEAVEKPVVKKRKRVAPEVEKSQSKSEED